MRRCIGSPCSTYLVLHTPRCVPCSIPGHLLRPMPASGFCVPVPVTSGCTGSGGGKFENLKKKCHFFQNTFFTCFVLCPAYILSVLS
ncbi:unnamed protein product, partial [Staurois parvus]